MCVCVCVHVCVRCFVCLSSVFKVMRCVVCYVVACKPTGAQVEGRPGEDEED